MPQPRKAAAQEEAPPPNLVGKLAEVMGEIGYIPKRGKNEFHGFDYATEPDIVDAVREKLATRGVILMTSIEGIEERLAKTPKGKDTLITTVRLRFLFFNKDAPDETIDIAWAGQGEDPGDKGLYKALTGAMKYFLMKQFLMPTGDDPDAAEGVAEAQPKQSQQKPPAPQAQPKPQAQPAQPVQKPHVSTGNGTQQALDGETVEELLSEDQAGRLREMMAASPKKAEAIEMVKEFGVATLMDLTAEQGLTVFSFLQQAQ